MSANSSILAEPGEEERQLVPFLPLAHDPAKPTYHCLNRSLEGDEWASVSVICSGIES